MRAFADELKRAEGRQLRTPFAEMVYSTNLLGGACSSAEIPQSAASSLQAAREKGA